VASPSTQFKIKIIQFSKNWQSQKWLCLVPMLPSCTLVFRVLLKNAIFQTKISDIREFEDRNIL
jgi:hypothetical protein